MVRLLDYSFFSRMEELKPLFFRSGHYATWMINLCKMNSIPILFIEWIVKMRNYQFSKSKRSCCSCKKLKKTNYKTADCKCGLTALSLPGNTMQYGVRNRSKVWNAYIFSKNHVPTSGQSFMSLPANISMSRTWVTKFFRFKLVKEVRG